MGWRRKGIPFPSHQLQIDDHGRGKRSQSTFSSRDHRAHLYEKWDSWVEINPETAQKMGIKDGDLIWVESRAGKLKGKARLFPGTNPTCINIPYGQGHKAYGRWAKGRGINPNELLVKEYDHLGGFVTYFSTRVKVYRA